MSLDILSVRWAAKKVLGPTLDLIGEDLATLYAKGRNRLIAAAQRKISNPEDGKTANLRVARDVLWNGAFSEDEICVEYFGGLLAASRTKDGKDDSLIPLVDVVKSLSSDQLRLHYYMYHGLNKMLQEYTPPKSAGGGQSPARSKVVFRYLPSEHVGVGDLVVLGQRGLTRSATWRIAKIRTKVDGSESVVPYASAEATNFGKMLYAAAYNNLLWWRAFGTMRTKHEDLPGVKLPDSYGFDVMGLLESVISDDWELVSA